MQIADAYRFGALRTFFCVGHSIINDHEFHGPSPILT
jgi:hypothetical protein